MTHVVVIDNRKDGTEVVREIPPDRLPQSAPSYPDVRQWTKGWDEADDKPPPAKRSGKVGTADNVDPRHDCGERRKNDGDRDLQRECHSLASESAARTRSTSTSALSFARQDLPFRRVGNCSFMANMPATLMAGTSIPSSTPGSSLNDPAGNTQSDWRPIVVKVPSGWRSKYAVLKSIPSHVNSQASSGGCVERTVAPAPTRMDLDRSPSVRATQNSMSLWSRVIRPSLASSPQPPKSQAETLATRSALTTR